MAEKLVKILIISSDPNEAESLVSAIISSGYAVHHNGADNRGDIVTAITQGTPDLILAILDRIDLGLPDIIDLIEDNGKKIPVIALLDEPPADISGYLSEGAIDVVAVSNLAHLQLVVDRTAKTQVQWNRMRQLETTILETEKRCQILLASAKDPIAYITDGMHVFANQTYLDLFGFIDQEDIAGTPLMDLAVREDQDHLKAFLRKFSRGKTKENVLKLKLQTTSGKIFPAEIQFDPAIVDREAGIQIIIHHQTDTNELEKQLSYLSQRDLMTGLYNRQYFLSQLQEAITQAAYGNSNSGVIHIGVDRFSELKQTFGISGSDLILVDFGKLLEQTLPEKDIACRFESNHFAVLTHCWQRKDLEKLMNTLQGAFNDHIYELDDRSVNPTASMGASVIDKNAPTPNEILNRAERAYKETLASVHGFAIYRPRQGEMTQKQLDGQWHQRLREAIKQNRLRLLFQPIVSLRFDAGEQYNVFMRMLDEHGRPIAAGEFMPSAERTGAAKMLDRWVIHEALEVLSHHAASKSHPLRLFVKLTAGSLQDPEILPWLTLQLQTAKVQGDCLVFEIKTSVAVNYLRQAREFQKGLRQLRSRLVLDAFGTAAKPFQLTRQIPAEFLKFDTSFMEDLPNNPENQEILKTLTTQAHAEGREVIAQRIEDPLSMSVLWGIGINYVQGNFLQVPSEHMNFKFDTMA